MDVEDVRRAFEDFDVDGKYYLDRGQLTALFNMVYPGENHREDVRALCGEDGLTLEKMEELLVNNALTDFDPAQAAFDGAGRWAHNRLAAVKRMLYVHQTKNHNRPKTS